MTVTNLTSHKRIAFLVEHHFEDLELQVPLTALQQCQDEVVVLGSRLHEDYRGQHGKVSFRATSTTAETRPTAFDAVVIPGGMAPDRMRLNPYTVEFVQGAIAADKLVAAIGHGPQILIEAEVLPGRNVTGFRSIRKDLEHAGAHYMDEPLVSDRLLLTARHTGDLPIFTTALLTRLGRGEALPQLDDLAMDWWRLGEEWGGSRKGEIVQVLNGLLRGEHYARAAFEHYADQTNDPASGAVFDQVIERKRQHIENLRVRLAEFDEAEAWSAAASEGLATLKSWLQSSDEMALLRRALADLQTGKVDAWNLGGGLTDPMTVNLVTQMIQDMTHQEGQIAALYRSHLDQASAPTDQQPTQAAMPVPFDKESP